MTQLLPPNELPQSTVTPDIVRKHRWDRDNEKRIAGTEFADGNARTERCCIFCGLQKITVHSPDGKAWREWKHPKAPDIYFQAAQTPPCGVSDVAG
jgi:hypothetical protein